MHFPIAAAQIAGAEQRQHASRGAAAARKNKLLTNNTMPQKKTCHRTLPTHCTYVVVSLGRLFT